MNATVSPLRRPRCIRPLAVTRMSSSTSVAVLVNQASPDLYVYSGSSPMRSARCAYRS